MLKAIGSKVDGVAMGPYALGKEYGAEDGIDDARAKIFIDSQIAEEVVPDPVVLVVDDDSALGQTMVEEIVARFDAQEPLR